MNDSANHVSRRDFLKLGLAGLGGLCAAGAVARLAWGQQTPPRSQVEEMLQPRPKKATVYQINEPKLLDDFEKVRVQDYLPEVVHHVLQKMTGTSRPAAAWRQFFSPQDIIGIKFDPVAADELRTTSAIAMMILFSLRDAGFKADKIMLLEGPNYTPGMETAAVPFGYQEQAVTVHKGLQTHFLRALGKVTAILNVPFIKDHRSLGLSCGTVNMTLGFVNNPGQFLEASGDPAVAELLARDEIRKKHRLTLVNGIRGIYDGGPRAEEGKIWNQCSILVGTDLLAVDRVAMDLIDAARSSRGLRGLAESGRSPKYLDAAARMGLGTRELSEIEVHRVGI